MLATAPWNSYSRQGSPQKFEMCYQPLDVCRHKPTMYTLDDFHPQAQLEQVEII